MRPHAIMTQRWYNIWCDLWCSLWWTHDDFIMRCVWCNDDVVFFAGKPTAVNQRSSQMPAFKPPCKLKQTRKKHTLTMVTVKPTRNMPAVNTMRSSHRHRNRPPPPALRPLLCPGCWQCPRNVPGSAKPNLHRKEAIAASWCASKLRGPEHPTATLYA